MVGEGTSYPTDNDQRQYPLHNSPGLNRARPARSQIAPNEPVVLVGYERATFMGSRYDYTCAVGMSVRRAAG